MKYLKKEDYKLDFSEDEWKKLKENKNNTIEDDIDKEIEKYIINENDKKNLTLKREYTPIGAIRQYSSKHKVNNNL